MNIIKELESLKQGHYSCEDIWYSCPKADEGYTVERKGEECDCGSDRINKKIDEIIEYIRPIQQRISEIATQLSDDT